MTMEHSPAYFLRKIAVMALIGFLVLTLGGPALALLGVLLPFILVGFLVWFVVRAAILGPLVVGRLIGRTVRRVAYTVIAVPLWLGRQVGSGLRLTGRMVAGAASILIPTAAGAVAGAALGALGGMQFHDADVRVPAGALIGASIGLVAVLWRSKPATQVAMPARQTMEQRVA
jgi:hypothetical protein